MVTVTAGIVVRNECHTLEASVMSIAPFVDEIIIVENGSVDATAIIIDSLRRRYTNLLALTLGPEVRLADARNLIDQSATTDWIVWWDADFIAYGDSDGQGRSFRKVIEIVKSADDFNQVLFGGPNYGPVHGFTQKNKPFQGSSGDTQITRKGFMRFEVGQFIDTRVYTQTPRTIYKNAPSGEVHFVHLDRVKPITRVVLRDLLYKFEVDYPNINSDVNSFREYLKVTRPDFNIAGAMCWTLESLAKELIPYDFKLYGQIPQILTNFVPLSWYQFDGSVLSYQALPSIDSPYLAYFVQS